VPRAHGVDELCVPPLGSSVTKTLSGGKSSHLISCPSRTACMYTFLRCLHLLPKAAAGFLIDVQLLCEEMTSGLPDVEGMLGAAVIACIVATTTI
jgi:hypothetical protein